MSSSVLRVFAVILAVGAIAIGYFGYKLSGQPPKPEPASVERIAPEGESAMFAAHDIQAGQVITKDDLTTALVPARPVRSYATGDSLIGRKAGTDIAKGEMVLSSHFPSHSQLALSLYPGERAVAVKVDEVIGTGGFIEPGDQVDVLLYLHADQEIGQDSSAQVVLSQVRVLAFGNRLDTPNEQAAAGEGPSGLLEKAKTGEKADKLKKEEPDGKKSKTAVLAIAEADAPTLLLAESSGRIRLALHGAEPVENVMRTAEAGLEPAALFPSAKGKNKKDKHYTVLRELIAKRAGTHEAEAGSGRAAKGAQVFVHRGGSTEILTLGH
nr:Flp pilus assembly protein CpaB [Methylomicrobium agile]